MPTIPDPFYTPRVPFVDDPRGMGRTDSERILEGPREVNIVVLTLSSLTQLFFQLARGAMCLEAYVQPGLRVNDGNTSGTVL